MSFPDAFIVAALSIDIVQGDKESNFRIVEEHLCDLPIGTDLLVLPELFSTGYIKDAELATALAETEYGDTVNRLKAIAKEYNMALCGSFLSKTAHILLNRGFFIEPDGEVHFYDKRHLFCISEESKVCRRGIKLPPIIRFRRWNISMAICYDIRFPAWIRNIGNKYDLLIIPANWPDKRSYAWDHLLKARAIENQAYVVGANRSGKDSFGQYNQTTHIIDYLGYPIGTDKGILTYAELSKEALEKVRDHFPVWKDADEFDIKMF